MRLSTPKLISFNSNNTYVISRESTSTNFSNYSNFNNMTLPIEKIQNLNYKIVLIGDVSVGKTSVLNRFLSNNFSKEYQSNLNANFNNLTIYLEKNIRVNINIWDTCGEEKFKSITKQYYRDASAVLLVYDLSNSNSLKSIENWLQDIKNSITNDCEIFLIGNKNDLKNIFPIHKEKFTDIVNSFYEVSAKTGNNIFKMFYNIIEILVQKSIREETTQNIPNNSFLLNKNKVSKQTTKKKCC